MLLKKKIQLYYKKIIQFFFLIIYGKIISQNKKLKSVIIEKINNINHLNVKKFNYKFYRIKNGRVFTNYVETLAIISENFLIKDPSFQQVNGYLKKNYNETKITGTNKFLKKFNGNMLVLTQGASGHLNYAHWLFDIVPKILIAKQKFNIDKIDYYYFSKLTNFQKKILDLIKIDHKKFIDANKYRHVQATNLLAVSHPNYFDKTVFFSHSVMPSWIIYSLRNLFIKKIKKKMFNRIFIDRSDSTQNHCKLINNKEIKKILKRKKFRILKLSNYSFIEQVSIFNNCRMVVAVHGAGLANLVFCKKKTKVIEIIPKNINNKVYQRISKVNELNYKSLKLDQIKNDNRGDVYLNTKQLNQYL
jgi:capsular polysaccharide biosynthesis protein